MTIRLHVLDGGTIDILGWKRFRPSAPPGTRRRLADPCYLIVHPSGTLLWDTGLSDEFVHHPNGVRVGQYSVFLVRERLATQLARIGIPPSAVDLLALSHFHRDHAGNGGLFPRAELLAQHDEYELALAQVFRGILSDLWVSLLILC